MVRRLRIIEGGTIVDGVTGDAVLILESTEAILQSEEKWSAFQQFAREVIHEKEEERRRRRLLSPLASFLMKNLQSSSG